MEFVDKYLFSLRDPASYWVESVIMWIGFSVIVGMVAKIIMLGRAKVGTIPIILLGSFGTIIGWSIASVYTSWMSKIEADHWKDQVLVPATFLIAVAGTMALLFSYKLLGRAGSKSEG